MDLDYVFCELIFHHSLLRTHINLSYYIGVYNVIFFS